MRQTAGWLRESEKDAAAIVVRAKECSVVGTLGWLATVVGTKRQRWATRGSEVLAEAGVEKPEWHRRGGKARR